jgi:hypothetical protein
MKFINNWIKKKAVEKEKRKKIEALFEDFVEDTRPLVTKAHKYPEAALYRHVWKRACVCQKIYQTKIIDENKSQIYIEFRKLAAKRYFSIASGKLSLSDDAHARMLKQELKILSGEEQLKSKRNRKLGCIYVGFDSDSNKPYIGQTIGAPEYRWKEHRINGSGPFKRGASYVNWKVIKENITPKNLDELESYYIGFFNAFEDGYNESKGNDLQAYERGSIDRHSSQ